jgi:hypothetical protein
MKHSLILYGVLFQLAHATTLLTPFEQTVLTEKLTLLIEQEHAHGHIPGDYPAASISLIISISLDVIPPWPLSPSPNQAPKTYGSISKSFSSNCKQSVGAIE